MSLSKNRQFDCWKAVEDTLRSKAFTCCGDLIDESDRTTVSQVFTLWCLLIRDLCGESRLRSDKALTSWIIQLANYPLDQIADSLKWLSSSYRDINRDMGERIDCTSFKQTFGERREVLSIVRRPFQDIEQQFFLRPNSSSLRILLSCSEFPVRMTLNSVNSLISLEKENYRNFEKQMKEWTYPPTLLLELKNVISKCFSTFPVTEFIPRHGNGHTSDCKGTDSSQKYSLLLERGLPPRLHYLFCQRGFDHPLCSMRTNDLGTSCRVALVPKGINSKRVISMEPTSNQWYQQSLLRNFAHWLPHSPFKVTMEDQTRNQALAKEGSVFRRYGTIDLSSASDSVSNTLVSFLFKDTSVWKELWACRSVYATLDGERILLEKFAPMGSAVCFPIESIIFSAVVILAMQRAGVHHKFVVYGDDIICHDSVFSDVINILEDLHFTVNVKKTFYPDSPFKESCGKEYYYGDDVTPFRIPRFFQGWKEQGSIKGTPSLPSKWIALANGLMSYGLVNTRSYLVHRLLELCPNVAFSNNSNLVAVQSLTPSNFHLSSRVERDGERSMQRGRLVKAIQPFTKTEDGADFIRYHMTLDMYSRTRRKSLSFPDDLITLKIGPSHPGVREKWLQVDHLNTTLSDPISVELGDVSSSIFF